LRLLANSEDENIEAIGFDRANSIPRRKAGVLSRKRNVHSKDGAQGTRDVLIALIDDVGLEV
jgi:hypothetical protein